MKLVDLQLLDELSEKARNLERKRRNLNYHFGDDDLLQRMLNAFEPGTYVCPHRHENPPKREVFILIRGRLLMLFFNNSGEVIHREILDQKSGKYAVEIDPGEWHMAISLEKGTVVYELKDGPYDPSNDKEFAPWAPDEGAHEVNSYLERLIQENTIG
jgi:cupin fold WbuC family metalloprotein